MNPQHSPTVSVLIPTYKYARYLPQAIESVLNQSFRDFELIISDDNSPDNSWDIINEYVDNKRVFAYKQVPNLGEYGAQLGERVEGDGRVAQHACLSHLREEEDLLDTGSRRAWHAGHF